MKKVILLLLLANKQFLANPCSTISKITNCGVPVIFSPVSGLLGDPNYDATTACVGTTTQGGLEQIYKFIAPTTGIYQFNVLATSSSNGVEYGYKAVGTNNCSQIGWTCLGVMTSSGIIDAINLNAGDSIFIIANARTTSPTSHTFVVNCAIPNPCTIISKITNCGVPVIFSPVSGLLGDPNYPATTTCAGTTTQGGLEQIYKFIAPSTGIYQFNVLSTSSFNSVEYGYKAVGINNCSQTGWTCLGVMNSAGVLDAINLTVGDSIFILANARTTSPTSHTFVVNCAIPNPCTTISKITNCGVPVIFSPVSGLLGDPNYDATTACVGTTTQGGLEQIYKFIAPTTGIYQFNVLATSSSNAVEYGYKAISTNNCSQTGWTCLGVMTSSGIIDAINLSAGDSIFIIANARTTSPTSHTFVVNCAIPNPCTTISKITNCGVPVIFSPVSGLLGDSNYPATTTCAGTTTQGGLEQIYKFIAPSTGIYQFNVLSTSSFNSVEYGYKAVGINNCSQTGWTCLGVMNSAGVLDAINLTVGDSIFILANARTTSPTSHTFVVNCAIPNPCTTISKITNCGVPVIFSPVSGLLGDPNYDATTACVGTTTQGGLEQIYKFIAPTTGIYQFNVLATSSSNAVEYGYKAISTNNCSQTGWTCLGVMTSSGIIDAINLNAGDSIFIIANARTTSPTSHTFLVNCSISTNIYENGQTNSYYIYPNPVKEILNVSSLNKDNNEFLLEVFNSVGALITSVNSINHNSKINMRDFPSGIYYLKLTHNKNNYFTKFVKE